MTGTTVAERKAMIRSEVLARRRAMTPEGREERSRAIARRLFALPVWTEAAAVHAYVGVEDEVRTRVVIREALAAGKRVACPKVSWRPRTLEVLEIGSLEELVESERGLLEPDPDRARRVERDETFDLALVPGIAFDRAGNRIGYGAGFYDRFLARTEAEKVALAFSLQIVEVIPTERHDVPVDRIVTENETIDVRATGEPGPSATRLGEP